MDLQQGRINIESIETKAFDNSTQYTIKSSGKSYKFYDTKKDGSPTKAMDTFEGVKRGMTVDILFKEEQKDYQGKPYTARTIVAFGEKGLPTIQLNEAPTSDQKYNDAMNFITDQFATVIERLNSIEKLLKYDKSSAVNSDVTLDDCPF